MNFGIFSLNAMTSFSRVYKVIVFLSQRLRLRKIYILCSSWITDLTSLKVPQFLYLKSFSMVHISEKKIIFYLSSELFFPTNPLFRQAALKQRVFLPMLTATFELFVSHLLFVNTSCLVLLMLLAPWKTSSIFLCLHTASKHQEICPWLGSPLNTRKGFFFFLVGISIKETCQR